MMKSGVEFAFRGVDSLPGPRLLRDDIPAPLLDSNVSGVVAM